MEMTNIPNTGFHPNDQGQSNSNAEQSGNAGRSNSETPPKRRPGRPKGSISKRTTAGVPAMAAKVKRPVGRPRKDGLPAGSASSPRPRSSRQAATTRSTSWATSMSGVGYPQHSAPHGMASMSTGPSISQAVQIPIDPNLQALDDWAVLLRTNPNGFLIALLSALAAPNPVSSSGPTVEEAFKSHLNSLAPPPNQSQPIPSLYSILKTFWLPSSPAYFSLTASASTARTPSEHRFLYWDPQPLVFNGIACPSCAVPLINRGRISTGPIKIYDIERPFFIIGCEYVCRSVACMVAAPPEGRKFSSTDASIFRALPVKLKDEFPARLLYADTDAGSGSNIWNWGALGVSSSLWNMVRACLRAGMHKEAILQLVDAVQRGVPEDESGAIAVADGDATKNKADGNADDGDQGEAEAEEVDAEVDAENGAEDEGATGPNANMNTGPSTSGGTSNRPTTRSAQNMATPFPNTFVKAYNDAWNANNGGASTSNPTPATTPPRPSGGGNGKVKNDHNNNINNPNSQMYDYNKGFAGYPYAAYAFFPPAASVPTPPTDEITAQINHLKRTYPFHPAEAVPDPIGIAVNVIKRSPRHCCKCGSQDCKGKGGRSFCPKPCQDCGKLDCQGRNSRRPDKKCNEGWL